MFLGVFKLVAAAATAVATVTLAAAFAQDRPAEQPPLQPSAPAEPIQRSQADPKRVWPAGMEVLAGRYVYAQVASPGGFWDTVRGADGRERMRQVAITHVPRDLREKLEAAEIVISDLTLPSRIEATEQESPARRGMLRFYDEIVRGKLALRNLPGISGGEREGDYSGPVVFHLAHRSHSNPTVSGVFQTLQRQEPTWGAAYIDYGDLGATTIPAKEGEDGDILIANARVLRSGQEIFAFIEWRYKDDEGDHHLVGSVRLRRVVQ
jgi:hypothetical protein